MSIDEFADEKTVIGDRMVLALEGAEESPHQAYLRVLAGPAPGQIFRVGDGGDLGRGESVSFHVPDSQISRRHARLRSIAGEVVLQDLGSTNGTFVNGERIESRRLRDGDTIGLGRTTTLRFTLLAEIDGEIQAQMFESALRDGLTKAYNKRFFETRLEEEVAYALRQDARLALLMLDLDHFKRVNDQYGHLAGDTVLTEFAGLVHTASRREDVFARVGGEEFAILARGLSAPQAFEFGERIVREVRAHAFVHEGARIPVSVSVGVAALPDPRLESAVALLSAADAALYRAKALGRDRAEQS